MIPEKYLDPSDESISWIKKQVIFHFNISRFSKYLILAYIPIIIFFYKITPSGVNFLHLAILILLFILWVYSTRKRNHLNKHLSLQIWLFDLMQYPDKVQHDKYINPTNNKE